MKKKLKNIANRLLDLGKRNRLLNYKDTGLKTLNILNRNYTEIFDSITESKILSFINTDTILSKYHNDLIINPSDDNVSQYSDLKVYDIINPLTKKRDLIAYKRGYSLEKVLKSLYREYKYSILEKGINTLYLSFGFIEYTEKNELYKAPLLLIPIKLSEDKGIYKIEEYEDEILLNPSLKYYLKTEKNIELNDYNDEDISEYFSYIRTKENDIINFKMGIAIGIYSFLKMNMYNDLIANSDIVLKNNNIRILLGENQLLIDTLIENPVYPVVNYDSSQLEAIGYAANGKSFVLQGPPGSGKSQTITNIISTLLGNGKKVLFVSEKLAALNVVYDNLKKAGLEDFIIELHSNKANKKEFIDNLYKTALLPKYDIDTKSSFVESKHEAVKVSIKDYYNELHKTIPNINLSIYDILSEYLNININPISYKMNINNEYTLNDLDKIAALFDSYANYSKNIGYNYKRSPFYGLKSLSNEYIRYELDKDFNSVINYLNKLLELRNKINKYIELNIITINDVYNSLEAIDSLVKLNDYHPNYLIKDTREDIIKNIELYLEFKKTLKTDLFKYYRESILKEDLEDLYINYKANCSGFFKIFNKKYRELHSKILAYRTIKASSKVILLELDELIKYKNNVIKARSHAKTIKEYLPDVDLKNLSVVYNDLKSIKIDKDVNLDKESYNNVKPYFTDVLISFNTLFEGNQALTKIANSFDTSIYNIYEESINNALSKVHDIYTRKDNVTEYILLLKVVNEISNNNFMEFFEYCLNNEIELDNIAMHFKKQYLQCLLYDLIDKSPILSSFTSYDEDKLIAEFKDLDEAILNINRDNIISINSKKRPDDVLLEGSKFKILITEANKLRRQKPIRNLLNEIFELALDIKPVFLMSPLSVSTYLANKENMFDCVIFDEASQIFAWDSLGAIYRAKQCIIIGDTKQMPPSNFFGSTIEDEEDNELELDSILDVASLSFLTSRLRWHYRSRSEELITFSNKRFYDFNLITVPQARKHEQGFGIDFYYLAEGRYDLKSRTNIIEANYICDMVFDHFKKSKQSLGVVAFSDVQARLIEDLVEQRIAKNPEFAHHFSEECEEPFFVKNLESVQGDERDRIIFSICYGYNENNKFYQRFGPLNNLGGERRLNVAITRAKYNISVVSSIKHTDIRLDNTESVGVRMLKEYLEFIENIEAIKSYSECNDGVINSVKAYLEELGYTCYPNYGNSQFKIDLAVMQNDEFVLAVMVDNKERFKTNTTDKYRLEQLLLERLGWRYYKVYSTAWFNHNELERDRLKKAVLDNSNVKINTAIEEPVESFLTVDNSTNRLEDNFIEYKSMDITLAKSYVKDYSLEYVIKELIKLEQPIHEDYLYKKIALILDARVTNVLKNMVKQNMPNDVVKSGKFYSIDYFFDIKLRYNSDRTIDQISIDELKNGIYTIVKESNGITIDGCYKALIKLLGFSRVTENTRKLLDDVVVYLKLDGLISQRGECLFI